MTLNELHCLVEAEKQKEKVSDEVLKAAKVIKKFCTENECADCPFNDAGHDPECLLAPADDNNIPRIWRILS